MKIRTRAERLHPGAGAVTAMRPAQNTAEGIQLAGPEAATEKGGYTMKKAIVIYRSKTGFSQQYAQWLAEELHCKALPFRERKKENLEEYDVIILTGGLYAGQMAGLNWLKKQLPSLRGKRIAAVAVGCAPAGFPGQPESMNTLFGGTPEIQGFYCQGGLDYEHMGAADRAMMAALRAVLKRQEGKQEMLEGISRSFDGTSREYLTPVIRWTAQG